MSSTANITLNIDTSNTSLLQALAPFFLPELAKEIVSQMKQEGLVMTPPPPDALIEVAELRAVFGKNGRPRSYGWFKRNFIKTGILTLMDNPVNRTKQYVSRDDAMRVLKAAHIPAVVKLENAG